MEKMDTETSDTLKNDESPQKEEDSEQLPDSDNTDDFVDAEHSPEKNVKKQTDQAGPSQEYQLRDRRTLKAPEKYSKEDFFSLIAESGEPTSYEEAITNKEAANWIEAMNEEIDSLKRNATWTLVDPPKNYSIID